MYPFLFRGNNMSSYEIWQWFLFFYIYCFFGFVWETVYVSLKSGKFENRGFMNGPFLPIYGSGAIVILIAVIPVRSNPLLVFLFGMISATILELFTGIAMEQLFHVRYWDYSYRKIQYKGYICLVSSIAWGVFSCLLIYGFHKPVENFVLSLPSVVGQSVTMFLTLVNSADFATSFKTALELKNMLITSEDIKKQIDKLERRAEIVEVFMADSAEKLSDGIKDQIDETFDDLMDKISGSKDAAAEELKRIIAQREESIIVFKNRISENKSISALLRRNPYTVSRNHKATLNEYVNHIKRPFGGKNE